MPDVFQMLRKPARGHQHHVDPHILAISSIAWRQQFGGAGYSSQPAVIDRDRQIVLGCARLDFDERDHAAAPCHQVDFANRSACSVG